MAKVSKDGKSNEKALSSGRKIVLKPLTLEIRDDLLDNVEFIMDDNGKIKGVSAMQKTITKWLKGLLKNGTSDEELLAWSVLSSKVPARAENATPLIVTVVGSVTSQSPLATISSP